MRKPYSEDFKIGCLNLIEGGEKINAVAKKLKVARTSLHRWMKEKEMNGKVRMREEWRSGHSHKIKDIEGFKKFVKDNQGLTSIQMAKKIGNITPMTVRRWMHRIKFSRKKRPMGTVKGMKANVKFIWMN